MGNSKYTNDYDRPSELKVYDVEAPEHYTVDSMNQEWIDVNSPLIHYWKIDQATTLSNTDDLGMLYGEATEDVAFVNNEPFRVKALIEVSPILEELSRAGLTEISEINFICNKEYMIEKIGRLPVPGDIFRISSIQLNKKHHNVFYEVASAVEIDLNLHRYINILVNAEQTALEKIPDFITAYLKKE